MLSAFMAIVKLTCRSAIRSHVFQFLLVILLLGVLIIPNTIKGDGSAYGFIQVSLEYSLSFISTMLILSAIWLGCQTMTADVEDSKLHLIVVKPVSRVVVWFGKLTGVVAILTTLLLISVIAVYGFVSWQYRRAGIITDKASADGNVNSSREQTRIANELLTGRRIYRPERPNIDELVAKAFEKKMSETSPEGKKLLNYLDEAQREKVLKELRRQITAGLSEVQPGMTRFWTFKNLPEKVDGNIFVRYRVYIDTNSQTAKMTLGAWGAVAHWQAEPDPAELKPGEKAEPQDASAFLSRDPEQILTTSVNELQLNGSPIVYKGEAVIGYSNFTADKPVTFQAADGPMLLIQEVGFVNNYFRAVLMQFLGILAVSVIAVSAASILSMPVAVFFSLCYLAFGAFSLYLQTAGESYERVADMPGMDAFGYVLSKIVLSSIIPLQRFGISDMVANGQLIEYSLIGSVFLFQVVLKGLPIALLGIWFYHRRELALASTKH